MSCEHPGAKAVEFFTAKAVKAVGFSHVAVRIRRLTGQLRFRLLGGIEVWLKGYDFSGGVGA